MVYRALRWFNRGYGVFVLGLYLVLAAFAFLCIFVFPPGALLMVFIGLFGLGPVVIMARIIGGTEHAIARRALGGGRCPYCSAEACVTSGEARWHCLGCDRWFSEIGAVIEQFDPHAAETQ